MKKLLSVILVVLMALVCMPVKETFADDSGEILIWQRKEDDPVLSDPWNGEVYRFSYVGGNENRNEIRANIDVPLWNLMKQIPFYLDIEATEKPTFKLMDGWWNVQESMELIPFENMTDNSDGTFTVFISIVGTPLVDVMDEKDMSLLLILGSFTPLKMYFKKYQTTGAGVVVDVSKQEEAIFTTNGLENQFDHVEVDGIKINENDDYIKGINSTFTLTATFLNSLQDGNHAIYMVYSDGAAVAEFSVKGHPKPAPAPVHEILNTGVN